ncbi:molybdopterin-dependent oxidoreductase [Litorisediminicola beolgyonensis]|uniref:Molybdopterin-dependent oxidoreductase n=1 Tax=Litorisediminicola beolgyonensis TaxID=1173614 RepID=A0ABW3ZH99_9RHOB
MTEMSKIATLRLTLDGREVETAPIPGTRLSRVLREDLGCRDVKIGCNAGDCGACTVLVDGAPVCACLMPAHQAEGRKIETVGGLAASDPVTRALGERFQDHGAAQCGICTPGMMVAATALLRRVEAPDETQVKDALGGVLCRCTGYRKIIDAVRGVPSETVDGPGEVGQPIRRRDGADKVSGRERFGDDVAPPGTLELRVIRSPYPRARVTLGDLEAVVAETPGLVAVLTASDVPGANRFGVIPGFIDQPVFAEAETRFRGEAVAALVGTPEAIAALDPSTLPVEWEPLAVAATPEEAEAAEAARLHDAHPGNLMCEGFVAHGDAESGLAAAEVTVEGRFRSGFVEHGYIEPEAGYAYLDGEELVIHACTQAPVMDRDGLAPILGRDPDTIRIVPTGVGGGFGSKLDLSVQPFLALAALKTGQPVRLTYSRVETMQSTTKRHPSEIALRIGARRDGRITGMVFEGRFDTGAYASWGPTVANRVPVHASGPYSVPAYRAKARGIYTNNPPAGAFRGFGVPQSAIAQEVLFDLLADRLGIDPLEFRLRNALRNGTPTVCGQVFEQGVGIGACLEALRGSWESERAAAEAFNEAHDGRKRGVGLAAGWYGCGNTSMPNPSIMRSGIRADGGIVLHQGAVDIGQGSNTVISQIFATALGVPVDQVSLVGGDTKLTPDAGKTSASRQTFVSGNAAKRSGEALRAAILARMNAGEGATLAVEPGLIHATDGAGTHVLELAKIAPDARGYVFAAEESYDPPTRPLDANGQGAPYAQFGYAAHLAVVEVDLALGTVEPVKLVAAHDVGRAINPMLVEGQVHGGVAQGLGMALMEEYLPGRTENLHDYLIPTIGDVPPIETLIVEEPDAHGPYGAKGLGEHALIPTAPAILNAIRHATGAELRQVPVTPARLRAALKEAGHG